MLRRAEQFGNFVDPAYVRTVWLIRTSFFGSSARAYGVVWTHELCVLPTVRLKICFLFLFSLAKIRSNNWPNVNKVWLPWHCKRTLNPIWCKGTQETIMTLLVRKPWKIIILHFQFRNRCVSNYIYVRLD